MGWFVNVKDFSQTSVLSSPPCDRMLAAVKMSSGEKGSLEVLDLTQLCPSLMEIRASSQRLRSLCMTGEWDLNSNSNLKTLFYKNCSLGLVKNLSDD